MIDYKEKFMKIALKEAEKSYNDGEVPIGAVIVWTERLLQKEGTKETKVRMP